MSSLTYTDPALVTDVKFTGAPLSSSATGYGPKIPTGFMVRYLGRWRRVYSMVFGNSGTAYIVVGGEDVFLDSDTEYRLAGLWS